MKILFTLFCLTSFVACKTKTANTSANKPLQKMASYNSPNFENAHPDAKKLMTDSFFFSPIEETAPFGSDDGSDTYANFRDWRKTHSNEKVMNFLTQLIDGWGYPKFDINETDLEKLKPYLKHDEMRLQFMTGIDQAIVASAFSQLYLEGKIDNDIKNLAVISINRELLPEIIKLWGSYEDTRKENLNKLLLVLSQVK